ncbi:MAG: ATP-binding cassette subfamily B protein [Glaciecola sp.]|jgi:ATP-binding cassette subfamily B protein
MMWLFGHLKPYKKQVAIALSALMLSSLAWLLLGQGIKYVIDQGFVASNKDALEQALAVVLAVVVFGSIATYFRFYWMVWLGERVCADIRKSLFSHLVTLTPSFFENTRTGEIISRFTSDTTLLQSVVGTGVSMALRSIVMFIGALVLMSITSFTLTILVFIAVPLMLIPIRVLGNKVRVHSKLSQDKVAQVGGMIDESLHEIHTLQAYNHEHASSHLFADKVEGVMQQARKRIHFRALLIAIVMVISMVAIFIVAYVGALMVIDQTISAGELTAFVFYAVLAGGAIATISEVIGELQKAAGASERIVELMQEIPSIAEPLEGTSGTIDANKRGDIALTIKGVDFTYPAATVELNETDLKKANKKVIQNVSFEVASGKRVAIVGHSGAGKSTLFELLLRFYDVDSGEIQLFGQPIKQLPLYEVRKHFALVPQDAVIFAGSVSENIGFSNPSAREDKIKEAAKMAFAHEFIEQLPEGYNSELGERGVKLSGGQKQRIAIARAIVANRPILLLDEATSSLDASSEQFVKKALEQLMQRKTTIIIAHRLSTVVNADEILVLDNGQIIARGKHHELYKSSAVYKEFVDLQLVE